MRLVNRNIHRCGPCAIALASLIIMVVSSSNVSAYAEFGYYTGAFGTVGEANGGNPCVNAVGQGVNPAGGCTPGDFPLARSTAVANGVHFQGVSSATADLAHGTLEAATAFTPQASFSFGVANFYDTFTVLGDLSVPQVLTLTMIIDSTIGNEPTQNPATYVDAYALVVDRFSGIDTFLRFLRSDSCASHNPVTVCHSGYGQESVTLSTTANVLLDDIHRTFVLDAILYAVSGSGAADHSVAAKATISLSVPTGLSLTSASGVFPTSAVPLPSPLLLFSAGIVTLAVRRRHWTCVPTSC
jgi:hypothetical protein